MRGHRDLVLVVMTSLVSGVLALLIPIDWLSLLTAAPLALVLPGYALASVIFARRPRGPELLLALTLGLSLAVLALGSVLLTFIPWGLRAGPWTVFLILVTLLAARTAALRRPRAYVPPLLKIGSLRPGRLGAGLCLVGAALTALAVVPTFVSFKAPKAIGYTELWIRPLSPVAGSAVGVGVGSEEQDSASYRLSVGVGGRDPFYARRFSLDPGNTKFFRVRMQTSSGGDRSRVVATLFRADRPGRPYRQVTAWINPEANG